MSAVDSNILSENGYMNLLQSDVELIAESDLEKYLLLDSNLEFESKTCGIGNNIEDYKQFAGILNYWLDPDADFQNLLEDDAIQHVSSEDQTINTTDTDVKQHPARNRKKRAALNKNSSSAAPKPKRRKQESSTDISESYENVSGANVPETATQTQLAHSLSPLAGQFITQVPLIPISSCLTMDGLKMVPAQQIINLPISPGTNIIICTAPSPTSTQHQVAPILPITLCGVSPVATSNSIPTSPDRNCSSSPFTPTAAELPNLPEAAAMNQGVTEEKESHCQQPPAGSLQKTQIPKSVESCKAALSERYGASLILGRGEPYVDVTLVKRQIDLKPGKVVSKAAEKEMVIYDLAEREKETVDLNNFFEAKERKEMGTQIIALLGESGLGKTVLVKKICQEWSNGNFEQFSLVFYFECRLLNSTKKRCSLKELLFELSSCTKQMNVETFQYMLRNPERVLLIFDGFDEFQDPDGLLHGSSTASPTKPHSIKELFMGLFQRRLLQGCTLLITARPREKFNQYLAKVDKIIETIGFHPQQVEHYIKEFFKALPDSSDALGWIKKHQYLFSYCYIPLMCKLMCFFTEKNLTTGCSEFNLSLAAFFLNVLQKHEIVSRLVSSSAVSVECPTEDTTQISSKIDLKPVDENLYSKTLVQNFQTAQSIMKDIKNRNLVKYVSLEHKKRKTQEICPDIVRRFLIGLLFKKDIKEATNIWNFFAKKQRKMTDYFKKIHLSELCPQRLLELCHCVYEISDTSLIRHIAGKLSGELSFEGTKLTPPDIYVLKHILKKSKVKISLDLRKTGIDLEGLQALVSLKTVISFRASLGDTVRLWKILHDSDNYQTLMQCVKKFTIDPFKVEKIKDITDLSNLVGIQRHICNCPRPSKDTMMEIPAITQLKKIILALGKKQGHAGFMTLVDTLPEFPALRYLDLHNLTENHIGDKGVEKLSEKFPELQSLETLDLSQNSITDAGVEKLAASLPYLRSLQTLSLYNNYVRDTGAERVAEILPKMLSLEELHLECNEITENGARKLTQSLQLCPNMKSLRLYSKIIPHAGLQYLQRLDSRISCFSIG
ncbi:MHC class II transactivator [Bombina bombina]|uniref:MHC class II transactivator n=1 Tax=Bombina bombina TaxID=8345 RepID=UPI00235A947D|nr:MHC class II transactivator [Bombina bombina]